ncbi:MAG: hypothetical protein ABIL58_00960 [Pseudomonadota bacterium]
MAFCTTKAQILIDFDVHYECDGDEIEVTSLSFRGQLLPPFLACAIRIWHGHAIDKACEENERIKRQELIDARAIEDIEMGQKAA